MTVRTHTSDDSTNQRKQRRFKTNEAQVLRCTVDVGEHVAEDVAEGEMNEGTVVDLSNSGMRLLCSGTFRVGQTIHIALNTDFPIERFAGVVRYVEPWTGGQTILGCSLDEGIDDVVLHSLADQGFLNRRSDPRVEVTYPAKMFWPLHPDRVDIELRDYSSGGLMIHSDVSIPEDKRLRVCLDSDSDDDLCVETRLQWKNLSDKGCLAGLAFVHHDSPQRVAEVLGLDSGRRVSQVQTTVRRGKGSKLLLAGLAAMLILAVGVAALELSGIKMPWAMIFPR